MSERTSNNKSNVRKSDLSSNLHFYKLLMMSETDFVKYILIISLDSEGPTQ